MSTFEVQKVPLKSDHQADALQLPRTIAVTNGILTAETAMPNMFREGHQNVFEQALAANAFAYLPTGIGALTIERKITSNIGARRKRDQPDTVVTMPSSVQARDAEDLLTQTKNALNEAQDLNKIRQPIKRILVTGSQGTVGSQITRALITMGYDVVGVDRVNWDRAEDLSGESIFMHGDLAVDGMSLLSAAEGRGRDPGTFDLVVHAAAEPEVHKSVLHPELAEQNRKIDDLVIEYCKNSGARLLYTSSREVYGNQPYGSKSAEGAADIADWRSKASPYAQEKAHTEWNLQEQRLGDAPVQSTVVRFSNVIAGEERRRSRVIVRWTEQIVAGEQSVLFTTLGDDGKEVSPKGYAFTLIEDTVDGVIRTIRWMDSPKISGQTLNISGPRAVYLSEFYAALRESLTNDEAKKAGIVQANVPPPPLAFQPMQSGELPWCWPDSTALSVATGYQADPIETHLANHAFTLARSLHQDKAA